MKRNAHFKALSARYLFSEIQMRKTQFAKENPSAKLLSLCVGDTSEPLLPLISSSLAKTSEALGTREGYRGYGPEEGIFELREAVAHTQYLGKFTGNEVFISDGAGCDIGRLQLLFGSDISISVPDPTYPAYLDGSLLQGVKKIVFLPCLPENDFFPEFKERTDLIYFCSPNNPTGKAASYAELQKLVTFAQKNRSIILFDAAYSAYVQDPSFPRSIYDIEGADEVAIEIGSLSKMAGFTGVRLGWTVVPEKLKYDDGSAVRQDWNRVVTTIFNGASIISQKGALTVLAHLPEVKKQLSIYLENARLLKEALAKLYPVYGGENAPYIWTHFKGKKSWDAFQELMEQTHIVATPGSGFGPSGEGFLRFSAFGSTASVLEAIQRLSHVGAAVCSGRS